MEKEEEIKKLLFYRYFEIPKGMFTISMWPSFLKKKSIVRLNGLDNGIKSSF